jgi:dienelactone hydrolase
MTNATNTRTVRRWWRWIVGGLLLIMIVAAGAFVAWAYSVNSMPEAQDALVSTDALTVNTEDWISFVPDSPPQTGFIFYPGGRVPAEAYAPLARRIAQEGYLVVIPYAPLRLAIINPGVADGIIERFSGVENWVVGGHSLGGATAAIYASGQADSLAGLIFLASFPPDDALADREELDVLSIYASEDGLALQEEVENSAQDLPPGTEFVLIEGGNHAQFGYYGEQGGDGEASISREDQITQTVEAITEFLGQFTE